MMVIFVSQCEKKALTKTRRVLDAFANRIGDNTWQTVMTQQGLDAVKKLLRDTATKNTAVSCHWLRSRSRMDLIWIVGSKTKFNQQGLVPVNTTQKDILVKYAESTAPIYANSQGQLLKDHLYAVGWLAHQLIKQLVPSEDKLAKAALIAGLWHDIGKLDPTFQNWLRKALNKKQTAPEEEDGVHIDKGKFSFEKHPRHNEISLILYQLLANEPNKQQHQSIAHAIYWHHAKPIRKSDFNTQNEVWMQLTGNLTENQAIPQLIQSAQALISALYQSFPELENAQLSTLDYEEIDAILNQAMPDYKRYSDKHTLLEGYQKEILSNSKKNLIRTAVIAADRTISALESEQLTELIESENLGSLLEKMLDHSNSHLQQDIEDCLTRFNQPENEIRNQQQTQAAQALNEAEQAAVLQGPAGCGKTKIALEWAALKQVKKLIWICPRVQVCLGIYDELSSDRYLPDTQIELLTGEFKKTKQNHIEQETPESEQFSGQIVITTIDQVLNTITTHRHVTGLVEFLNAHVVFDEFHELIKIPAINLLFAELVQAKQLREEQAHCLLVSATINPLFVQQILEIDDIIPVETFNQSNYHIEFSEYDEKTQHSPLITQPYPPNTFVISNTAKSAQQGFIQHQSTENAILFHGRYKKNDKREIFEQVYSAFKQEGNQSFDILRSGPIVQASLNISCEQMFTELTSPENWLQRLGRLNRFAVNQTENLYTTFIPLSIKQTGKQSCQLARFLNKQFEYQAAYQWYLWLIETLPDTNTVTLSWLYQQYQDFYAQKYEVLSQEILTLLQKSAARLNQKLHDPIAFKPKPVSKNAPKLKASSLRGDSRFVQLAVIQLQTDGSWIETGEYACDATTADNQFTLSVDEIQGYDEAGDNNLIQYMFKKHHKILQTKGEKYPKRHKSYLLKKEATNANTPIYLSYTQQDLDLCHDTAHEAAIYYVMGNKQPIGALAIQTLNPQQEN